MRAFILGVALLIALSGCAPMVSESGYTVVAAAAPSTTYMTSKIEGTLTISGECYAIDLHGSPVLTVFPVGTHVADGDRIEIPEVGVIGLGDELSGGGGEVTPDQSPVDLPVDCPTDSIIIFEAP